MKESIKKRIEAVRRGEVPEKYSTEHAMLFPDEWGTPVALNTVLSENKDHNEELRFDKEDVLSVSGEQGIVNQIDFLGRSYAGESVAPYHVVETGDVVYTKSPLKENPYGIIKQNRGAPGIVSTLYAVYHCRTQITGQYLENYFCIDTYLNNYLKPLVKRGAKNDMKVNNEEVLLGRIPLPSLQEQERINEIITQFDRMIELKQSKIDELNKLKQVFLLEMFPQKGQTIPKRRFPGFSTPWEQRKLGDITELKSASRVHKEEWTTSGVPFYRSSDVMSAINGTQNEKAFISEELYKKLSDVSGKLEAGDVLVTGGGSVGNPYIVPNNEPLYTKDADLLWIKNQGKFYPYFLYEFFFSPTFRNYLTSISHVGTIAHYTITQLSDTPICLPNFEEQKKVGEYFQSLDNLITLHQRELAEIGKYKKALMQLLLTGLVRVNA